MVPKVEQDNKAEILKDLANNAKLQPAADQSTSAALSEPLTRAAAAELLDGALDVLAAREARSWLPW